MKIYDALAKDHQKVKELLDELLSLDDDDEESRRDLVNDIRDELVPHARAEESILYNSLRELDEDKSVVMHSFAEHVAAETLLRSLQVTDKVNTGWRATAEKLKEALEHHIEEEESKIFDAAREVFSDEEAVMMGLAFERMKPQIRDEGFMKNTLEMAANLMPPRLANTLRKFTPGANPTA